MFEDFANPPKGKGKEKDRGKKRGAGDPKMRLEFCLSDLVSRVV